MSSKKEQRRRQLAQARWERQQQRRLARKRRRRRGVILGAAAVVAVAAGGGALAALSGGDGGGSGDQASATESSTAAADPCEQAADGEPSGEQWDSEPEMTIDTSDSYVMTLQTTCGDIEITLDAENAPHTVNSFKFLADEGYFDHTECHRLTTSGIFVLQCGDPEGTGNGGPGYELDDENLDDTDVGGGTYPKGTVAMANSGADTGGSQFFLVYKDSELSNDYTPFGEVTKGMDVLQTIADAGTDDGSDDGAPSATVVIDKARVEKREES